jgi:hypothetical protein
MYEYHRMQYGRYVLTDVHFALIPPDATFWSHLTGDSVLPCMNFVCFSRPAICCKTQDCNNSRQNRLNPLRMSAASIHFLPFRVEKRAMLFP